MGMVKPASSKQVQQISAELGALRKQNKHLRKATRARPERRAAVHATRVAQAKTGVMPTNTHKDLAEEAFLMGFVDPDHPARGPGSATNPTILGKLKSSTSATFSSAVTGEWLETTPGSTFPMTSGNAVVVVMPHLACGPTTSIPSGTASGSLSAGFALPGDAVMQDPVYGSGSKGRPLVGFQSSVPDLVSTIRTSGGNPEGYDLTNSAMLYDQAGGTCVPYRTVGLRATVTVTDPLTDSTGMLFAGDGGDYFADEPASRYDASIKNARNIRITQAHSGASKSTAFGAQIGDQALRPRVVPAGAFSKGDIYEASLLPISDRALQWCEGVPNACNDNQTTYLGGVGFEGATDYYFSTLGENLMNNPSLILEFRGLREGAVCNIDVTWAVEFQVEPRSSIGFLLSEARFAPRFVPDWMEFACCVSGGPLGDTAYHYLNCAQKGAGYLANITGRDLSHPAPASGVGAVSLGHRHSSAAGIVAKIEAVANSAKTVISSGRAAADLWKVFKAAGRAAGTATRAIEGYGPSMASVEEVMPLLAIAA